MAGAPVRRHRFVLFFVLLFGLIFFFGVPWELPQSLKEADFSTLSRASIVQLFKPTPIDELYGLLHFTTTKGSSLNEIPDLDSSKPVEMSVYARGDTNLVWKKEVKRLNEKKPIIVFSKVRIPLLIYSARAKQLLKSLDISPPPKIIEVDLREDTNIIKSLLTRLTQHSTFLTLQALHSDGKLVQLIEAAGAKVKSTEET
ncbi:hypothetical protein BD779DRAFT_1506579 [Infundibulicybe gibba]|nr:hypothetical protein BD779DRAFT_1506579 [Infundibulicybe gibba]